MYSLASQYHYMRIAISPASTERDVLGVRKTLQDALTQMFGITSAGLYIDVLWMAEDSHECVIRSHKDDASKVLAALVAWSDVPSLRLVKESPYLPSLTVVDEPL